METAAADHLTDAEVCSFAASIITQPAYKEIIRIVKARILRDWASEADRDKRDALYHDIQAVARFEGQLRVLSEQKQISDRHAEFERRRAEKKAGG